MWIVYVLVLVIFYYHDGGDDGWSVVVVWLFWVDIEVLGIVVLDRYR